MKREKKSVAHNDDSELIRRCTLDRAGIMFVTDLIKDMLTSLTLRRNTIAPEMIWVRYSTFRTLLCRCSFPIKYVKYDSMVNKK